MDAELSILLHLCARVSAVWIMNECSVREGDQIFRSYSLTLEDSVKELYLSRALYLPN